MRFEKMYNKAIKGVKGFKADCQKLILDIHPKAGTNLRRRILKNMHPCEELEVIKEDEYIILYGNDLVKNYCKDQAHIEKSQIHIIQGDSCPATDPGTSGSWAYFNAKTSMTKLCFSNSL